MRINILLTFGTLEYWTDRFGNEWSVRPFEEIVHTMDIKNQVLNVEDFEVLYKRNQINE